MIDRLTIEFLRAFWYLPLVILGLVLALIGDGLNWLSERFYDMGYRIKKYVDAFIDGQGHKKHINSGGEWNDAC